ncbi:unnamed protein product [Caenorhabditis auriculariae]|uniref:Uncharacterized protein n=1 Tax=Caenorhabditis auriculariae TaxID=2777116 RepID=A0A8S1HHJ6_9PELO|nr:unnamed protein product [Caenorhabditis auriculariae]
MQNPWYLTSVYRPPGWDPRFTVEFANLLETINKKVGDGQHIIADGSDSGVKLDICVMWKFGAQVRTPTPSETVTTPQETPVLVSIPPAPVPQVIPPPMPRPTTVQTSSAVRLESPPMPTPSPSSSAESSDVFSPHKSMPMAWDVEVTPRSNARSSFIDDEIETISVRSHREEELPIEEELVPEAETPSPEIIPALPVELIPSSPSSSSSQVTVEHGVG